MDVSPSRSLGSFEPCAWRMNVRRMPSAPPNSPASNTTLSRGDAWPDWDASVVVQSSWANTNAAKSTSWESSTRRSRVDRPGLNVVVQGSTSATSSSPRVIDWRSLACLPDEPMKIRGLFMRDSPLKIAQKKRRGGTMAKSVREAMTEDPRSIGASASVVEAARLMREQHIGSLPVTEDEQLVGMITDRDITIRVVAEAADPKMTSVGDVYSRDLISVEPDKDLAEALQLMARHQVRRLPVVENGRHDGIVAQAYIALRENEKKTGELVEAISEPSEGERR